MSNAMKPALQPKTALLQYCDKQGLRSGLSLDVRAGEKLPGTNYPTFICTAKVPIFEPKLGSFVSQVFESRATTKKASEHAAALSALVVIHGQGLLPDSLKIEGLSNGPNASDSVANTAQTSTANVVQQDGQGAQPDQLRAQNQAEPPLQTAQPMPTGAAPVTVANLGADPLPSTGTSTSRPGIPGEFVADPRNDAEVERVLGRKLASMEALELRDELQKALDRNTELKSAIHHEHQRRERALGILLGLS